MNKQKPRVLEVGLNYAFKYQDRYFTGIIPGFYWYDNNHEIYYYEKYTFGIRVSKLHFIGNTLVRTIQGTFYVKSVKQKQHPK